MKLNYVVQLKKMKKKIKKEYKLRKEKKYDNYITKKNLL